VKSEEEKEEWSREGTFYPFLSFFIAPVRHSSGFGMNKTAQKRYSKER
jgi:hypothetical protein